MSNTKPSRELELQALRGTLSDEELAAVHAYWLEQGADPALAQSADDSLVAVLREVDGNLAGFGRMDSVYERLAGEIARRTVELRAELERTSVGNSADLENVDRRTSNEPPSVADRDSAVIGAESTRTIHPASSSTPAEAAPSEATFLTHSSGGESGHPGVTMRDGALATPTEAELVPGLQLGAYRIVRRLGQGGMGTVFLAEHIRMERLVALKVLAPRMTRDAHAVKRFHREVKAAARLSHPNIVTAYDADEARGMQMLVMEYVEGTDLSALVKSKGPLSVESAVNAILQAARGLEFAHAKGIVHRDIKPANLLVDESGVVKVLDMGLARVGEVDETPTAGLTMAGTIMGTVEFMAPEQAVDTRTADARADIYSLGCTLFYLLSARPMFTGDTVVKIIFAHRDGPIPSLCTLRPDVSGRLDALFQKMVAKRVEDRHQSMTDVIAELEAIRSEGFVIPSPHSSGRTVAVPKSVSDDLSDRLQEPSAAWNPSHGPAIKPAALKSAPPVSRIRRPWVMTAAAGAVFLLGVIFTLKTREGTVVLKIDPPDADIAVVVDEKQITVTRPGDPSTISIAIDPGRHRLKLKKAGIELYAQDFEIGWGGRETLTATLKPKSSELPAVENMSPAASRSGEMATGNWDTPEFRQWMAEVKDFPAEKLLEAVSKKMVELNPGFDGKLSHGHYQIPGSTPVIERGKVVEVGYSSPSVSNVAPLRAFGTLRGVSCAGSPSSADQSSLLVDISPLRGMGIERFCAFWNVGLSDYTPIVGPQLRELQLEDTKVTDLAPLRGIPLQKLNVNFNGVTNLQPLVGMPLDELRIGGYFDGSAGISDLSPLKGMRLKGLFIAQNFELSDLSPLAGMPLGYLIGDRTKIESLEPLRGIKLRHLALNRTRVSDLSPLQGMPLEILELDSTPVSDLSPLADLPLRKLVLSECRRLKDFSVLRDMSLTELSLDFDATRDTDWLRSIKTLETINGKPVAEFWKEVAMSAAGANPGTPQPPAAGKHDWDTPEFRQWLAEVKDLPANKLLEAVSKKMVELNPGFDGRLSPDWPNVPGERPVIQAGRVIEVGLRTSRVTDLSPLRAFGTLRGLSCVGWTESPDEPRLLVDLSPLRGMKIERFSAISNRSLADISPVCSPELKELDITETIAGDLSVLRGLRLRVLTAAVCGVSDLSPLRGMPLETLFIQNAANLGGGVSDLSPLKGMPLRSLSVRAHGKLKDVSPLAGMPLELLDIADTGVESLDPLRGMRLKTLACIGTRVTDLAALKGMPLTTVELINTPISDLSPLRDCPLKALHLQVCPNIKDTSVIGELPLEVLWIDYNATRDESLLKAHKSLMTINGKPVAEFWKEVASESAR